MRILILSNMYPRPHHPAGGIFIHEQVKALRNAGIDARVVSGEPVWLSTRQPLRSALGVLRLCLRNQRLEWKNFEGVPVQWVSYPANPFCPVALYPLLYASFLAPTIRRLRDGFPFQLVHAHTAFLDGSAAAAIRRRFKVPVVLTEHTGPFSTVTEKAGMRLATTRALNAADRILAVSRALAQEIPRRVRLQKSERLSVLPNGVNSRFFSPRQEPDAADQAWVLDSLPPDVFVLWASALLGEIAALFDSGQEARLPMLMRAAFAAAHPGAVEGAVEAEDAGGDGNEFLCMFLCLRRATMPDADFAKWIRDLIASLAAPALAGDEAATRTALLAGLRDGVRSGDAEKRVRILWVGHLVAVKRLDRLIEAFAIAHRHEPRLHLTLVGSGPLEDCVKKWIASHGVAKAVTLRPTLPRAGVRDQMRQADFLVVSSETETFGVVIIEALSLGKPVLSTRCGGPEDILSEPRLGLLVGNDMESLAIGMGEMARRIGTFDAAAIRAHAVEVYDFSKLAGRLVSLYEELLEPAPSVPSLGRNEIGVPEKN